MKTINRLDRASTLKLYKWLTENRERLEGLKLDRAGVADMASKALGFSISSQSIQHMIDTGEVTINFATETRGGMAKVHERQTKLRDGLIAVFEALGETPPDALTNGEW